MTLEIIFQTIDKKINGSKHLLVLDIGGTSTQIGILGLKNGTYKLKYESEIWTNKIHSFPEFIAELLKYIKDTFKFKITEVAISVAGPISKNRTLGIVTNQRKEIKTKDILKKIDVKKILLLNDFEAIAYSINILEEKNKKQISGGRAAPRAPIAVIGAGTGLGKSLLYFDTGKKMYLPLPSEGAHTDYPIQTKEEQAIMKFLEKQRLQQEDLISGRGIETIYKYLRKKKLFPESKHSKDIDEADNKIFMITKYKTKDKASKEAFKLFSKFYAKVIKNYLLDTLPVGGIYLAGGITIRNPEILGRDFKTELNKLSPEQKLIKEYPIYIATNKNISLLGAAFALQKRPELTITKG